MGTGIYGGRVGEEGKLGGYECVDILGANDVDVVRHDYGEANNEIV